MNTPRNVIIIDDDYIDNFITDKLIRIKYPEANTTIFQDIPRALQFIDNLEVGHQRYVLMLDLYMDPNSMAWSFLDIFEQLPKAKQSSFDIYMMSCSCEKRDVDRAKEYKTIRHFFEKPISEGQLHQIFA